MCERKTFLEKSAFSDSHVCHSLPGLMLIQSFVMEMCCHAVISLRIKVFFLVSGSGTGRVSTSSCCES